MKFLRNILSVLSPISFLLAVWRRGEFVGEDQIGNRYFRADPRKGYTHEQRWVLYNGEPDASKVPPEWHGWLHHQTDSVPDANGNSYRKNWQVAHRPNLTGTQHAYQPHRAPATGDYQSWRPE